MSRPVMEDYKRAIRELQTSIEMEGAQIREALKKLGEHLSYEASDTLPDPAMRELHGRIQELRRQLPESRQQVKRILQTVAGNEALEREIRDRKVQIGELSRTNRDLCESIGRVAFRVYKRHPAALSANEDFFETLEEQEQGLAELEGEQQALRDHGREGKFFRIFRETGKSVYLKGLISLRRKAVVKSYDELGRMVAASSELKDELEDRRLGEALAPYEANDKEINRLQRELENLIGDQEKKWAELKKLGAHRSHQKRVREIESEIQRIEATLEDTFEGLGTMYRSAQSGDLQDSEAASLRHQIEEIEGEIRAKKKRIERLNAALRIEGLQGQLGDLNERVSKLEGEIEARRRETETLRAQISEGEKEVQRLQKIRGSKQTLLVQEEK
jgi:DNA repair exonuclease SbcCD ATPase subunit